MQRGCSPLRSASLTWMLESLGCACKSDGTAEIEWEGYIISTFWYPGLTIASRLQRAGLIPTNIRAYSIVHFDEKNGKICNGCNYSKAAQSAREVHIVKACLLRAETLLLHPMNGWIFGQWDDRAERIKKFSSTPSFSRSRCGELVFPSKVDTLLSSVSHALPWSCPDAMPGTDGVYGKCAKWVESPLSRK